MRPFIFLLTFSLLFISINTFAQPSCESTVTHIGCDNESGAIDVTVSGGTPGYFFTWTGPNGFMSTTQNLIVSFPGTYFLVVTDGLNETCSLTAIVEENVASSVTNVTCNGANDGCIDINVTFGTPPYTYNWNDGQTTEDICNLVAGTYIVTITDTFNETCIHAISIAQPELLEAEIIATDTTCSGVVTLEGQGIGGTPPFTYTWNTGETIQIISASDFGIYSLTVTDANACIAVNSYFNNQAPPQCDDNDCNTLDVYNTVTCACDFIIIPAPSCDDNNCATLDTYNFVTCECEYTAISCVTMSITPTYENVGDQVRVDFPYNDFELISSFEFSMDYDPASLQFDSYGLFNLPGLSASNFTNPSPGKITVSWADPASIGVTLPDGTSTHSIYFTPLTTNQSVFEITATPIVPNFYTSTTNPMEVDYGSVTIIPNPSAVCLEADAVGVTCFNGDDGCIEVNPIFGVAPYTYEWSNGASTSENCNLTVGDYSVTVTDVNLETCIRDYMVSQPENPLTSTINYFTFECTGISLQAEVSGGVPGYDYIWSDGSLGPENFDLLPGLHELTITDAVGCETTSAFFVPENICDTLTIQPVQATVGNQIRIDFEVENFNSIIGLEHIVFYDASALQFDGVGDFAIPSIDESHFDSGSAGNILLQWLDMVSNGISLADGSVLYSLYFTVLNNSMSTISIGNFPVQINSSNGVYFDLVSEPIIVFGNGNFLTGTVYYDQNLNCVNDGEPGFNTQTVTVTDGTNIWNVATEESGAYSILLTDGVYEVSFNAYNSDVWSTCQDSYTVDLSGGATEVLDIGVQALLDCALMEVDVVMPLLRRCFLNAVYVSYCNYGSITAEAAYVDIELDPNMILLLSPNTPQPSSNNGNTYIYDLGDVAFGECGTFRIDVYLDVECNETILGETHCVTGTIFPNQPCEVNPLWSGASLDVTGSCDGEYVNFVIENIGLNDMNQVSSFIVIEDQVMGQAIPEDFLLGAGESVTVTKPANGTTYRVTVNQVPYHPSNSSPSVAVEGCGVDANGEISLGMVTMFNLGDGDGFEDIECMENIGSYDPNDKRAMVQGFGDQNFIYANEQMEYVVRFQNTGTDTAFNIVIKDELSPNFDITSLRPGASSHAYTYSIEDERTMVFTFENIMLPDSTIDLAGSNGFISYKVDQLLDNPDGTVLENTADIYFDFNAPITTNTTYHEIGSDFVMTSTFYDEEMDVQNSISIYPNPSTALITFELDQNYEDQFLEIYDITGQLVMTKAFDEEKIMLTKSEMGTGMYFYAVTSKGKQLTTGKFIFL